MLETIRRYWIGSLVLVLVVLHASIVGVIRYQASLAKKDVSCEVALGEYLAYRSKSESPIEMNLHAIVPLKHRMKSRQLIELNEAQIRQSLEEHLRQFDGRLLADPYLTDMRSQLLDILTQTLGASSVEDIVVTRIRTVGTNGGIEFLGNMPRPEPRKLVATLREEDSAGEGEELEEHTGSEDHEATEADDSSGEMAHREPAPAAKEKSGHGKTSGHH